MSRARPEQIIQRAVFDHLRARAARGVFAFHVLAVLEQWGILRGHKQ
jgi:hypothetical protein